VIEYIICACVRLFVLYMCVCAHARVCECVRARLKFNVSYWINLCKAQMLKCSVKDALIFIVRIAINKKTV